MPTDELDTKDSAILQLLKNNARLTYSEIGTQVGLSRTAVKNRVSALERYGVIRGYQAIIETTAAPAMLPFIVNIETRPECFDEAKSFFQAADETKTLIQTNGRCHLVAICIAPDLASMRNWINAVYRKVPGILNISTHSILDIVKGHIFTD